MADETLFRSLEIGEADGRTLSGVAVPFDQPTRVRDLIGPAYVEAFSPTSADVSIRQHPSFPVFVRHDYGQDPLGVVSFTRSEQEHALLFEAPLSKTARADEVLELVTDGAMRSVSIGFRPLQVGRMQGVDAYRTEIALRELSLAPTGFGQYASAGVLALRTDSDEDPGALMQAVDAAIDSAIKALDPADDDFNPDQASALLVAAEATVDALLDLFGLVDADDLEPEGAARDATQLAELTTRIDAAKAKLTPAIPAGTPTLDALQRRAKRIPALPTF